MKALFVGAGRRVTMASYFKSDGFEVDAYEYDIDSPINLEASNIYQGLKWSDPNISNDILELIEKNNYDIVLPFQDEATRILSKLKNCYPDSTNSICVSEFLTSEKCLDKKKFELHFLENESITKYYPKDDGSHAVIKPRFGFGSKNIQFVSSSPGIVEDDRVIQKRIFGNEYSIDCCFDANGTLIDYVPRKRLQVTGGEVVRSCTVSKDLFGISVLEKAVIDILKTFKFAGPICMQFIVDKSNKIWIMEINARFGGGATLSIAAGCNIVKIIKDSFVLKKSVSKSYSSNWKKNFYMSRAYQDYYYEKIVFDLDGTL